jgi:Ca2+-binding RTX toxin-like protein
MSIYAFETISAAQALAFSSEDSLRVAGSAKNTAILYNADGSFTMRVDDRSVVFSKELEFAGGSRLTFGDDTTLYIGSPNNDVKDYGAAPAAGGAMYGGAGVDTLTAGSGAWLIQGNQGADQIKGKAGFANTIYGGQDDDTISLTSIGGQGSASQFMQGNKGNDTLQGGSATDTLLGGQGDDHIFAASLPDVPDFINGNLGNDILEGSGQLFGEAGDDNLDAYGASTVSGGDGDDRIQIGSSGAQTRNTISGDEGNDTITGSTDTVDTISGGGGNDLFQFSQNASFGAINGGKTIDGGLGDDTMIARGGQDVLRGDEGADSLNGGADGDLIEGGAGADTLNGGAAADFLTGGADGDRFVFDGDSASIDLAGADRITDWQAIDQLRFGAAAGPGYAETTAADFGAAVTAAQGLLAQGSTEVVAVQVGADVVVFADGQAGATIHQLVLLIGRTLADISGANVI